MSYPQPELAVSHLHPFLKQHYRPSEMLGTGGFGTVLKGTRLCDGLPVAIKMIPTSKLHRQKQIRVAFSDAEVSEPGLEVYKNTTRVIPFEAFVLRKINHPGVVKFVDLFDDDSFHYIVMGFHGEPWSVNGPAEPSGSSTPVSVYSALTPPSSPSSQPKSGLHPHHTSNACDLYQCIEYFRYLPEPTAAYVFAQIVEIIQYLVDRGIVHGDIKDQNFLIDKRYTIKLIDFGAATMFDPKTSQAPLIKGIIGTRKYAAPEVLQDQWYDPVVSDVWSMGVLLFTMLTGTIPFRNDQDIIAGLPPVPRYRMNPQAWDLIKMCLEKDVTKRIKLEDMWKHPWLNPWFDPPAQPKPVATPATPVSPVSEKTGDTWSS